MQISSLMDTWLLLYNRESNGEHNRQLYLLKSRGMAHSNQVREFILSSDGIKLRELYVGPEGVLTGSARLAQETKDKAARSSSASRRSSGAPGNWSAKRREIAAQIEILQAQLASEEAEVASAQWRRLGAGGSTGCRPSCHGSEPPDRARPDQPAPKPANKPKK